MNCILTTVFHLCTCIAAVIDVCELEQSQVCEESVLRWCVEEHAMDMDIAVLQQVEELEHRVISASLQVKVSVSLLILFIP